jgi:hypothetical protein
LLGLVIAADRPVRNTHATMAGHLPPSERAQRGAALLVALAIGLVTLAVTDNDGGEQALPGATTTSAVRVLGAVVTAPPDAAPAEPVPVEVPETTTSASTASEVTARPTRTSSSVRRSATTTTGRATTSTTTSPSTDPTLIPPTVIENTTTTSEATTTTEAPTTTETTETTAAP